MPSPFRLPIRDWDVRPKDPTMLKQPQPVPKNRGMNWDLLDHRSPMKEPDYHPADPGNDEPIARPIEIFDISRRLCSSDKSRRLPRLDRVTSTNRRHSRGK